MTSRELIVREARTAGFETIDRARRSVQIQIGEGVQIRVTFDKIGRIREAEIDDVTAHAGYRALRPCGVGRVLGELYAAKEKRDAAAELPCDDDTATEKPATERVKYSELRNGDVVLTHVGPVTVSDGWRFEVLDSGQPVTTWQRVISAEPASSHRAAKAKLAAQLAQIPLCEIDDPDAVERVEPAGDALFDALESSYVAVDGFGTRDEPTLSSRQTVTGHTTPAETPRRSMITAQTDPIHFVDVKGEIPILSADGLLMLGKSVNSDPGTPLQRIDALTSLLLGIFESRSDRDELLTYAYYRGHAVIGSTSTTAARFLAREAVMMAALDDQPKVCPACGRPASDSDPLVFVPADGTMPALSVHRSHTTDPNSGFYGQAVEQPERGQVVGPVRVRTVARGAGQADSFEVALWSTKLGGFATIATMTGEEADALHTALGRELYG